jgi:hypothetical protein
MAMTIERLFREDEIYNVRVANGDHCIAAYEPNDYLSNIVADIYGNGYKIKNISAGNHTVVFFVEDIVD